MSKTNEEKQNIKNNERMPHYITTAAISTAGIVRSAFLSLRVEKKKGGVTNMQIENKARTAKNNRGLFSINDAIKGGG